MPYIVRVRYAPKPNQNLAAQADGCVPGKIGPFEDRTRAENALVSASGTDQFRGGYVEEVIDNG